jgi:FkbM family methyltransferase
MSNNQHPGGLTQTSPNQRRKTFRIPGIASDIILDLHDSEEHVSNKMEKIDVWEPTETHLVHALLRQGDFFLDVGANIGYYVLLSDFLVGGSGRVVALEPDEENFHLLQRNVKMHGFNDPGIYLRAAGAENGHINLYKSSSNYGDHHTYSGEGRAVANSVEVCRLDDLIISENRRPRVVKIDCQGAEGAIIDGMSSLWTHPDLRPASLIMEFWPYGLDLAGTDIQTFTQHIWSLGYEVWDIGRWHARPRPCTRAELLSNVEGLLNPADQLFTNLLLIDRSHVFGLDPAKVTN